MFDLEEIYASWLEDTESYWSNERLNDTLAYQITESPENILDENVWSELLASACPPPNSETGGTGDCLQVVINGLKYWSLLVNQPESDLDSGREAIEKYLFLTRLHLYRLDTEISQVEVKSGRVKLGSAGSQVSTLLEAISRTIQTALSVLYPPTVVAKRSSLALLYLEPTCKLLQHNATLVDKTLPKEITRVMALGVKLQHQQSMVKTQLIQLLTYYEHASPFVVSFLETLNVEFDHTSLAEAVLRDVTAQAAEWKDSQESANVARAKSVNSFVVGLASSMPLLVSNNLPSISMLLNSPFSKLRIGTIETAPIIVKTILEPSNSELQMNEEQGGEQYGFALRSEDGPMRYKPAFELVEMIEPRINDVNHFVRAKTLQSLSEICKEHSMISRRNNFAEIAVLKLSDRSQLVRRQAMILLRTLMQTHPQIMHEKNLSRRVWTSSLEEIDAQLHVTDPDTPVFQQLEAGKAFVEFTLQFINYIEQGTEVAETLLNSRSKSDILDSIDLLVYADAFNVDASESGIKAIVHLVWAKADNDENNDISYAAVNTYHQLFFSAAPDINPKREAQIVASNLIYLTANANQATLTSLERLLVMAVEQNMISVGVISRLWGIYQTEMEIDPERRRGAAIVLGMMALADRSIACSGIGSVVNIGLKRFGPQDYTLAAHSCIILKRSIEGQSQQLPPTYDFFDDIIDLLLKPSSPKRGIAWMSMAKEALAAIATTCDQPSKVYTRLVIQYLTRVYGDLKSQHSTVQRTQLLSQLIYLVGEIALNLLVYLERSELEFKRKSQEQTSVNPNNNNVTPNNNEGEEEEDMMGGSGTQEDDFQDIMREFRENVIFYSDKALLKPFTGIVTEICKSELRVNSRNNTTTATPVPVITTEDLLPDEILGEHKELSTNASIVVESIPDVINKALVEGTSEVVNDYLTGDTMLALSATQTLSKFMCVSSRFCEENLPLLVSLMSQHQNNVVRSNFVVALGDIAICFNRLIDDHSEYLYDRLDDTEEVVQRTCIVALTFLILAGQIKVKGRLGEMAKTIVHPNQNISSLAKMFFNELSSKENAIYNSFLDILSTLVHDVTLPVPKMSIIVKYIAKRLDKEKQMKKLTDKLVNRMKKAESYREWTACSHAISGMSRKIDDDLKAFLSQKFEDLPGQAHHSDDDEDDEGGDDIVMEDVVPSTNTEAEANANVEVEPVVEVDMEM